MRTNLDFIINVNELQENQLEYIQGFVEDETFSPDVPSYGLEKSTYAM